MIHIRNMGKTMRNNQILKDVCLEIENGVTAVVGTNGSGKSTLIRCLVGQWQPSTGEILIDGSPPRKSREKIGFLQDPPAFYEHLNAEQMLRYYIGISGKKWRDEYLNHFRLWSIPEGAIKHFSRGQRQRLGIVCSYWYSPNLWVLDEPFTGLDGEGSALLWNMIESFATREGNCIVMVLHDGHGFPEMIDSVVRVSSGTVDFQGGRLEFCQRVLLERKGVISAKWSDILTEHRIGFIRSTDVPTLRIDDEAQTNPAVVQVLLKAGFNPLSKDA